MSTEQLTADVLALPVEERANLMQALWDSIDDLPDSDPAEDVREAVRRGKELTSGAVIGHSHEEVMAVLRRAAE